MQLKRYFYRCRDCLTVVANESEHPVKPAACDACEGSIECLGRVVPSGKRAAKSTPCDYRCTNARGPNCDCVCGGRNHGSWADVRFNSSTPVPRLMIPKSAAEHSIQFWARCRDVEREWKQVYGEISDRMGARYLDADDYKRYVAGVKVWNRYQYTKKLRSHAGRMKRLNSIINELTARTRSAK